MRGDHAGHYQAALSYFVTTSGAVQGATITRVGNSEDQSLRSLQHPLEIVDDDIGKCWLVSFWPMRIDAAKASLQSRRSRRCRGPFGLIFRGAPRRIGALVRSSRAAANNVRDFLHQWRNFLPLTIEAIASYLFGMTGSNKDPRHAALVWRVVWPPKMLAGRSCGSS